MGTECLWDFTSEQLAAALKAGGIEEDKTYRGRRGSSIVGDCYVCGHKGMFLGKPAQCTDCVDGVPEEKRKRDW